MPNERTIQAKKEIVDQLKAKLDSAVTCVVVDYKGISVEDDTKLRKQLREAGVDYFVAKNTMLRLAAKEAGYEGLNEYFKGTHRRGDQRDRSRICRQDPQRLC